MVGILFAVLTYRRAAKTRRAEFSLAIWEAFSEPSIREMYNQIEWGRFRFPSPESDREKNPHFPFSTDTEEVALERLLSLFDEIALLYNERVFSEADKEKWNKHGAIIFKDRSVSSYLLKLDQVYCDAIQGDTFCHQDSRKVFFEESLEPGYLRAIEAAL